MTDPQLTHFISAQNSVLAQVEAELTKGAKCSHWMWFIFPQIAGLGHSMTAQKYSIADVDQARMYLEDPVLGERLRQHVRLMLEHKNKTAREILGTPDDLKFRSCLTLFREASVAPEDEALFEEGLRRFYSGQPDAHTIKLLRV